jgi:hypothetical protein
MPSRDYFTYDERPDGQAIEVGSPQSTPWGQFKDFFVVKGIILSEQPDGPAMLAAAYGEIQGRFQRAADQLDDRAHKLREVWAEGPAADHYFWFAGATLYGLDHWVENLDEKIDRLTQLVSDITDAHSQAEALEQQFKSEYLSRLPANGAFYGFPPDLSRNNPAIPDDEEAKLKAQVRAIYEEVHAKYLRLIIKVGEKLGKAFVKAAEWLGSAGKVPVAFQGADAADPWRPYTPDPVSPTPVVFQFADPLSNTPPSVDPAEVTPLALLPYDGTDTPPPTWTTDTVPPYGDGRQPANGNGYQSLPPIPTEQVPQHGLGATAPGGTDATTSPDNSGTTTGRGVLLGRGFLIGVPPAGAVPPRPRAAWSTTRSAGSGPPGATLAGRFGEPLAVPPSESLPSALSARGAQPVDVPSPATQATAADGPMGSPVSAAIGWQQALSARATMPPPAAAGDPRSGRERSGVLGDRRRAQPSNAAAKPTRSTTVDRGGVAEAKKRATSEPRPTIQGTVV